MRLFFLSIFFCSNRLFFLPFTLCSEHLLYGRISIALALILANCCYLSLSFSAEMRCLPRVSTFHPTTIIELITNHHYWAEWTSNTCKSIQSYNQRKWRRMEDGKIIKPLLLMDGFELHRQAAPLVRRDNNKQIHPYIHIYIYREREIIIYSVATTW